MGPRAPCTRFEVPTDECAVEQKVHGGVQARIVLNEILGPPDVVLAADPHGGADSPLLQNSGVDFVERDEGGASSEAATIKQDFARVAVVDDDVVQFSAGCGGQALAELAVLHSEELSGHASDL